MWPAFEQRSLSAPLIYFTNTSSYVVNPTEKFIRQFQPVLKYQNKRLRIFKTRSRIDNIPFHMETSMTTGSDTSLYTHNEPFIKCSSLEDSKNVIQDLTPDSWAGMIVHEFFHNYQFRHPQFAQRTLRLFSFGSIGDSLQRLYTKYDWFRQKADEENQLLLEALQTSERDSVLKIVGRFFSKREERRSLTKQKLNITIDDFEKSFETFEGTARYVEAAVLKNFSEMRPSNQLLRRDPDFKSYNYASNNQHPEWLYKTNVSDSYFYATGYNITRLLNKLQIDYQPLLFKTPDISLEELLQK